ncbi:MAG: hypothetical protein CMC17_00865 [Flavobacteriaceae bacterium]|nr:hypothetical protein [Flavobacteriaceae bacterium]OUX31159.1 MAG: hypothetical protein CBE18_01535 [Pelagibacteraceae bacterium TMED258]
MDLYKILKVSAIGLSLLGIVFVLLILSDVLSGIDMILYNAYVVLFIIISSVLYFGLKNMFSDKSNLMTTLKMIGSFLGLFALCFILASGEETLMREGKILSATSSKFIGAALFMFYSLIIIASGTMLFFGFIKTENNLTWQEDHHQKLMQDQWLTLLSYY